MKFLKNTKKKVKGAIKKLIGTPGKIVDRVENNWRMEAEARTKRDEKMMTDNWGSPENYRKLQDKEKQREAVKGSLRK